MSESQTTTLAIIIAKARILNSALFKDKFEKEYVVTFFFFLYLVC